MPSFVSEMMDVRNSPRSFEKDLAVQSIAAQSIGRIALVVLMCFVSVQQSYGQSSCPFMEDEVVVDTLDPAGYYPLQIGEVREFITYSGAFLDVLRRREVIGDTLIENHVFYKTKITAYAPIGNLPITQAFIGFDYKAVIDGTLFLWTPRSGIAEEDQLFHDFKSCYESPAIPGELNQVDGAYDSTYTFFRSQQEPRDSLPIAAIKEIVFGGLFATSTFGYGIGRISGRGDPSVSVSLSYAVIDGQEYGTPLDSLFDIQVAVEEEPAVPREPIRLASYPNPFRSTSHLAFSLASPGEITIRISDVLGRVVAQPLTERLLLPGAHTIRWDGARFPSGLYLVQVVVDGQPVASTTLTLIR